MSSGFKIACLLIVMIGAPVPGHSLDDPSSHPRDAAPNMPRTQDTIPDKMQRGDPDTTGSTREPRAPLRDPNSKDEVPSPSQRARSG